MSTFVNVGNMTAKYDTKSGVIRLTSNENGNPLKENGIAFNVYPGNKRYDILRDMIEDSSDKPLGEVKNRIPQVLHISEKYRSNDPSLVPLGIDDNKQVFYWDIKKHPLLSVGLGNSKSNTMGLVLDHVQKHKNTKAFHMKTFSNMGCTVNPWDENIENYVGLKDKEFIGKVSQIMENRSSYLKEMNVNNLDQEIAAGRFNRVFVVLSDHSVGSYLPFIQKVAKNASSLGIYLAFLNTETKEEKQLCNTYSVLNVDFPSSGGRRSACITDSIEKHSMKSL